MSCTSRANERSPSASSRVALVRAPTLFLSRPVSGSRYGSTGSVESIAGACSCHQLIRADATGDVLLGILTPRDCHLQALHLAAVNRLRHALAALGRGRRGDGRRDHDTPPRSPCGSTLHNPSWHSRPDSCWTALEFRWRRGSKHSRPLPERAETNSPLPGRPQERHPRTRRGRQDPGGQHHRDPRPARAGRGPVASGVNVSTVPPRSMITQAIAPETTDRRQPDPASKLIVDGTPIACRTTPSATRESARPPGTTRPVACTLAGHLARLPATLPGHTHDTTASGPPTNPSRPRER